MINFDENRNIKSLIDYSYYKINLQPVLSTPFDGLLPNRVNYRHENIHEIKQGHGFLLFDKTNCMGHLPIFHFVHFFQKCQAGALVIFFSNFCKCKIMFRIPSDIQLYNHLHKNIHIFLWHE